MLAQQKKSADDGEDKRKRPIDFAIRKIALDHLQARAARLGSQPRYHGGRTLNATDIYASGGNRKRNPAGADAQFEYASTRGQFAKPVDQVGVSAAV